MPLHFSSKNAWSRLHVKGMEIIFYRELFTQARFRLRLQLSFREQFPISFRPFFFPCPLWTEEGKYYIQFVTLINEAIELYYLLLHLPHLHLPPPPNSDFTPAYIYLGEITNEADLMDNFSACRFTIVCRLIYLPLYLPPAAVFVFLTAAAWTWVITSYFSCGNW